MVLTGSLGLALLLPSILLEPIGDVERNEQLPPNVSLILSDDGDQQADRPHMPTY